MTNELAACPFCGEAANTWKLRETEWRAGCNSFPPNWKAHIAFVGTFDTEAEAIAAWNTRTPARQDEGVEDAIKDGLDGWIGISDLDEAARSVALSLNALRTRTTPPADERLREALDRLDHNLSCAPADAQKCFVSLDDHRTILAALNPTPEIDDAG